MVEIEGRSNEPFELGMAAPRPERSRESLPSLMAAGGAARGSRSSGGEIWGGGGEGRRNPSGGGRERWVEGREGRGWLRKG